MSPRISKKHAIAVSESTYQKLRESTYQKLREIAQRNGEHIDVTLDSLVRKWLEKS